MTTHTAFAAAPGYKWRRQAPLLSARSSLACGEEPFLRNKQIFRHCAVPPRTPITKQTHFRHCCRATNSHYETNPFSALPKLRLCPEDDMHPPGGSGCQRLAGIRLHPVLSTHLRIRSKYNVDHPKESSLAGAFLLISGGCPVNFHL